MKSFIVAIALVVLSPSLAHAHAQLSSSMPPDQASLTSPPNELMLHFSEAVRLTALTLTRDGEQPQKVDSLPAGLMKDFTVASPALAVGRYTVSWRALAADSHVMTGTFTFTVGAVADAPAPASHGHAGHPQH